MTKNNPVTTQNVLELQRVVNAPPERVFDAWTDAHAFGTWMGGHQNNVKACRTDPRPGGKYRLEWDTGDDSSAADYGKYLIVDRPHRLQFTWFTEHEDWPETIVTLDFERVPQGTRLTLRQEPVDDARAKQGYEKGWTQCLDGLVHYFSQPSTTQQQE